MTTDPDAAGSSPRSQAHPSTTIQPGSLVRQRGRRWRFHVVRVDEDGRYVEVVSAGGAKHFIAVNQLELITDV